MPEPLPTRPNYADAFHCIGPACEDTCCQGWQIPVDKPAFDRLLALPASPLRTLADTSIDTSIQPTPANPPSTQFAHIQLRADGACPFLSQEKLCTIQSTVGEEYMPLGCTLYPRVLHRIDHILEKSLSLSCPEAARLVLLNPTLFCELASHHTEALEAFLAQATVDISRVLAPRNFFWPIRELQLGIVFNRRRSIRQRLSQLGALARQLDTAVRAKRPIIGILQSCTNAPPAGKIRLNLNFLLEAMNVCLDPRFRNPRLTASITEFLQGISFTPEASLTALTTNLRRTANRHYKAFLNQHFYLLENYLANYIFRNLYPFGWTNTAHPNFELEYQKLAAQFTLIEGLLTGISGHRKQQMTAAPAVHAVQSLTRSVEHNPSLLAELITLYQQPANQSAAAPERAHKHAT